IPHGGPSILIQAGLGRSSAALTVAAIVDQQEVEAGGPGQHREVETSADVLRVAVEEKKRQRRLPLAGNDPGVDAHSVPGRERDVLERQAEGRGCGDVRPHGMEEKPRLEEEDGNLQREYAG